MISWDISIPYRIVGKAQTQTILPGFLEKLASTNTQHLTANVIAETIFSTAGQGLDQNWSFPLKSVISINSTSAQSPYNLCRCHQASQLSLAPLLIQLLTRESDRAKTHL